MSDKKHTDYHISKFKFDNVSDNNSDNDSRFVSNVKNQLILIKDFYGAESSTVYWFNLSKNSFKLLVSSEDEQWNNYTDRFEIGSDFLSTACSNKTSVIYDDVSEFRTEDFKCFNDLSKVKSVIINPLEIGGDVLAVLICESKTRNFFGNPNLYSLQIFSESIIHLIKYFILREEYESQNVILKKFVREQAEASDESIAIRDRESGLYSRDFFHSRLSSEMSKCRLLGSNELIVIYTCIDNPESVLEFGIQIEEARKLYVQELKIALNGYDMIFSLDSNLIGIMFSTGMTEKTYLELEKIRRSVSTKIFTIDGRDLNFTVSFAAKKYVNLDKQKDDFLKDILDMLEIAKDENGNVVKF